MGRSISQDSGLRQRMTSRTGTIPAVGAGAGVMEWAHGRVRRTIRVQNPSKTTDFPIGTCLADLRLYECRALVCRHVGSI